jgi:hypothetical protein
MSFLKRLIPIKANIMLDFENLDREMSKHILKGYVRLVSEESFKVENIRLEVKQTEIYTSTYTHHDPKTNRTERRTKTHRDVLYSHDFSISESFDVVKGFQRDFPFEIEIPDQLTRKSGGSIDRVIKAVANVKGRPDITYERTFY